ncbi:transferase, Chloramphenicol acetyltransferase-like domain protein [Artemisia annua]|uniref:Transferase, Chloramphenicol acetyltransferase-like domain protein n=1 Tax=Artemisia annua TaxID=35608 RepID=A0A2U1L2T7_ARTAN|nr:transferase, Chloramphenicol acetyltransferase-like domain protein [Artemisia annua]
MNPSRFEVLASLVFKCAVAASTNKSYDSSVLYQPFNVRGKIAGNYPETIAGNVITVASTKRKSSGQIQLNEMVNELRKRKMEVEGLRDLKEAAQYWTNTLSTLADDRGRVYSITTACVLQESFEQNFVHSHLIFLITTVTFGQPLKVTFHAPEVDQGYFVLMDTPSGDGIEATAHLRRKGYL